MVSARIYAEGGGDGELLHTLFRQAWHEFFQAAGIERMPRVIAGGGRSHTYDLFLTAMKTRKPDDLPLLLLDSEGPVRKDDTVWQHLKARDNWDKPNGAADDQAFLMVQVMESWFVADLKMLEEHFGASFRAHPLKAWPSLEDVPKETVLAALEKATDDCGKARYAKGKVSFRLLGKLNPDKVETACPHAKALLDRLRNL